MHESVTIIGHQQGWSNLSFRGESVVIEKFNCRRAAIGVL